MILSSWRILLTTFWDAKLYSKGSWDIRKEPGMNSQPAAWSVDSEVAFVGGSWVSQRSMQPGEWLNAREGSGKIKNMKASQTTGRYFFFYVVFTLYSIFCLHFGFLWELRARKLVVWKIKYTSSTLQPELTWTWNILQPTRAHFHAASRSGADTEDWLSPFLDMRKTYVVWPARASSGLKHHKQACYGSWMARSQGSSSSSPWARHSSHSPPIRPVVGLLCSTTTPSAHLSHRLSCYSLRRCLNGSLPGLLPSELPWFFLILAIIASRSMMQISLSATFQMCSEIRWLWRPPEYSKVTPWYYAARDCVHFNLWRNTEVSLGFFHPWWHVVGPGEVIWDVHSQKGGFIVFTAALFISGGWCMCLSIRSITLLGFFFYIEEEMVVFTPLGQLPHLYPVVGFIFTFTPDSSWWLTGSTSLSWCKWPQNNSI